MVMLIIDRWDWNGHSVGYSNKYAIKYRFLDGTVRNADDHVASSAAEISATHSDTTIHLYSTHI